MEFYLRGKQYFSKVKIRYSAVNTREMQNENCAKIGNLKLFFGFVETEFENGGSGTRYFIDLAMKFA
jgi:hypothetical protein